MFVILILQQVLLDRGASQHFRHISKYVVHKRDREHAATKTIQLLNYYRPASWNIRTLASNAINGQGEIDEESIYVTKPVSRFFFTLY